MTSRPAWHDENLSQIKPKANQNSTERISQHIEIMQTSLIVENGVYAIAKCNK